MVSVVFPVIFYFYSQMKENFEQFFIKLKKNVENFDEKIMGGDYFFLMPLVTKCSLFFEEPIYATAYP